MTRVVAMVAFLATVLLCSAALASSQQPLPWTRFAPPDTDDASTLTAVSLSHNAQTLFVLLDLREKGLGLSTAAIYFDTDMNAATGSVYPGGFGPRVVGWERKLVYGQPYYKPEDPGFVILPDSSDIFRTEQDGTISFYDGSHGWVHQIGGNLVLSVPLSALGNPRAFDFVVVGRADAGPHDVIRGHYRVAPGPPAPSAGHPGKR